MYRICIFAGTTEGRELAQWLSGQSVDVTVCCATEYGGTLVGQNVHVSHRRLSEAEMEAMLRQSRFDLVIDATHPYAVAVTKSIAGACRETGTEYLRLLRGTSQAASDAVYVQDAAEAASFLDTTDGTILLTTGSKELGVFAGIRDFPDRVYARVLPIPASLEACAAAGVKPGHILAMQGPFSQELNCALLRFTGAGWLVTKDGGQPGGFEAKVAAARELGVRLLVIGRPPEGEGCSYAQTVEALCRRFGCVHRPKVSLAGIGPGSREAMTGEVVRSVKGADCLIGAKRMLEAVARPGQAVYEAVDAQKIADFIHAHPEYSRFVVALSGDAGFYSGAKKLLPLLEDCQVEVLPGLSSLVTLCARLQTSYEDVVPLSLHGREGDLIGTVRKNRRVFVLVGGEDGMAKLCRTLTEAGLGGLRVSVGERLGYPEEKILRGKAQDLAGGAYHRLSVALIENDAPDAALAVGLPDEAFQRGGGEDGVVPMTKSEVRAVCLSKLRLTESAVCWDVGAGTGSVSIEMALNAPRGQVYAIERNEDALNLLEENRRKFAVENLTIVSGCAPEACRDLPAPTHVFIGGSGGSVQEILALAVRRNPRVRIVVTAISLETVGELTGCLSGFARTEVVALTVARDRRAGRYHLMTGQNPIYLFTLEGGAERC